LPHEPGACPHILALPGKKGLFYVCFLRIQRLEKGGKQVSMVRVHLPQKRQDSLIAQYHFPCRLKEGERGCKELLGKRLCDDPLPGIELEHIVDRSIFKVHELS